eukprot:564870-Amorphochlora_amoeboformis.AAC.1
MEYNDEGEPHLLLKGRPFRGFLTAVFCESKRSTCQIGILQFSDKLNAGTPPKIAQELLTLLSPLENPPISSLRLRPVLILTLIAASLRRRLPGAQ